MNSKNKQDIFLLSLNELERELLRLRIQKYRAKQIFEWIYKKGALDFGLMTNLSVSQREILYENFRFPTFKLLEKQHSEDGATKYLFELHDGRLIETVLISFKKRNTICISTQVGCKYGCVFCASGARGFTRNLVASEIIMQVFYLKCIEEVKIDNYVFMGMGEPLDNCSNLEQSIQIMNSKNQLGIAARRITVSTNGIIPGIERLKNFNIQVNLALSLHAVTQEKRKSIMPVASKYSLAQVLKAVLHYYEKTHRIPTIEYILLKNINDKAEDASGLAEIAKFLKAKVNLIPYSPVSSSKHLRRPMKTDVDKFLDKLLEKRVNVTVRNSKGRDIKAACGQLAGLKK
ncbi:MAG: 23S rRNA (adenine(2503)-C(2))-methyltransferase RlmN [bacterium]|nr:23S rRNA (adenine(2503)-C(2))-methyltransferase RlmN [bacterium]